MLKNNTENPFIEIGLLHNNYLEEVGIILKDTLNKYLTCETIPDTAEENLTRMLDNYTIERLSNTDFFQSEDEISIFMDNAHSYTLSAMNSNLENDDLLNFLLNNCQSEDDFMLAIDSIENTLISSIENNGTLDDSIQLLSITILKYSFAYWLEAYYNETNPWHGILTAMNFDYNTDDSKRIGDVVRRIKDFISRNATAIINAVKYGALCDYATLKVVAYNIGALGLTTTGRCIIGISTGVGSAIGAYCGYLK